MSKYEMSKKLIGILGKNELSIYDVKEIINTFCELVKENGISELMSIEKQIKEDIEYATHEVSCFLKVIKEIEEQIDGAFQASFEKSEKLIKEYYKNINTIKEKIKEADLEIPTINLPYNWKEYIEFANALNNMTKSQREIFLDFAKKLKEK